jgi:hypothetical protein
MLGALKKIFLWLVIAALPLQGFASVVASTCGPDHELMVAAGGAVDRSDAGGNGDHHHVGSGHPDVKLTSAHAGSTQSDHEHHHKTSFCGTCGACCAGAFALSSTIVWAPSEAQFKADIIAPAPLVTGFIPGGLERPPRPYSA